MKRATRQRVSMLAAAIALVAVATWQWQRDRDEAPGTLLTLPPSDVMQIELRIGNGSTEHFTKRDGHWWRVDGAATRADDGRLAELADTAAASVLSWRPLSDFQPARIGLAPPMSVLNLDGQQLEFGETSVTGPQRYVRVGDRVALVSVRYTPRPATQDATKAR